MKWETCAYCGIECTECPAYIAKQKDDDTLREKTAAKWGASPEFPVSPSDINCDGCKSKEGMHFKFCSVCKIRACASEKEVKTCAHCANFSCETLEEFMKQAPEDLWKNLKRIFESLWAPPPEEKQP
jgi:hypothetical protein